MKETKIINLFFFLVLIVGFMLGFCIGFEYYRIKIAEKEQTITIETSSELDEWEVLKLAIIKTESEFNPLAVGKTNDFGIFQITPIYVKEVNRILGEERYTHEDAFSPMKSIEMFNIMQGKHNPHKDIERAISLHNPTATSAYSVKVRKNMAEIERYETLRKSVKQ